MTVLRVFLAVVLALAGGASLDAQALRTIAGNRQVGRLDRLDVEVQFAAGHLSIGRDESGMLYRAKVVYDEERFEPLLDYSSSANSLRVGVDGIKGAGGHDKEGMKQELKLDISPKVPVSFDIKFGAAEADVDLGGLNLTDAEINTGATKAHLRFSQPTTGRCRNLTIHVGAAEFRGEKLANARCERFEFVGGVGDLTLDFTGDWGSQPRPRADITVGLGSLTLRLPKDVGVQVDIARVFSSFERSGLVKGSDGAYYSANFDGAAVKLRLNVKSAMGSVNVEWR